MIENLRAFFRAYRQYLASPKGRYEYERYGYLILLLLGICCMIWSVMSHVF